MRGIGAFAIAALTVLRSASKVQAAHCADVAVLVPQDEEAEQILYELASFEARYYAEEGTSMVLAGENLVGSKPFTPNTLNNRFAAAFRHYAKLLATLRSDLSAQDVGPVVELIAHRDFVSGSQWDDE